MPKEKSEDEDQGSRFYASIQLRVQECTGEDKSGRKPFFDSIVTYHELGYDGVLAVEAVLGEALGKLTAAGFVAAEAKGMADGLAVLKKAGICCPGSK